MGQFSVEICHLVGQFSMKLNTMSFLLKEMYGQNPAGSSAGQPSPRKNACIQHGNEYIQKQYEFQGFVS